MRTLFLELNMGAAGDMLMAALLELHPEPDAFLQRLNGLGIPGVEVRAERAVKCGIAGTHVQVTVHGVEEESVDAHDHHHDHEHHHDHDHGHGHDHDHHHAHDHHHDHVDDHHHDHPHDQNHHEHVHGSMEEINALLASLPLPDKARNDAIAVYQSIAGAESRAHGVPVTDIHFHEVGAMDAVADIVGVCMLMEELAPERVLATPVHVGSGNVRCAHGVLPVPAPATAYLLEGIPAYGGSVRGELCTPTGAALLRHFVDSFGDMPVIAAKKIGYGMGKKDFEAANCVRAILGETPSRGGEVAELSCNLDDMTPEAVAFAQQLLMERGALDVYTTPIGMKKGRQGVLLTCMCKRDDAEDFARLIFQHTTTLGIRESVSRRYTLSRKEGEVSTRYGTVRVKTATGWGVERSKVEYEDIARIARERGISVEQARREAEEMLYNIK